MIFLKDIKRRIKHLFQNTNPVKAYNTFAPQYDLQKGNLLMEIDKLVFEEMLDEINLSSKTVLDFGCGTGRHWNKLTQLQAKKIIGVDRSKKMLEILVKKFPDATVYETSEGGLKQIQNQSIDLIISNLTIGYIKDILLVFQEWDRVLSPNGRIILTEYHPTLLQKGGGRSFTFKNKTIHIKNYIHSIEKIREMSRKLSWHETNFKEKRIDESVKEYYAKQNALLAFEHYKGEPLCYGLCFKKL